MKKLFLLIASIPIIGYGQLDQSACATISKIDAIVKEKHYNPKPVDDSLSVFVYNDFIEALDPYQTLFTQIQIEALKKHQTKIDDYILAKDCSFLNEFYSSYQVSVANYKKCIQSLQNETLNFTSQETIKFHKKKVPYLKNEAEILKLHKKRFLFEILKNVSEKSKNKDSLTRNFTKLVEIERKKTLDAYLCKSNKYDLSLEEFRSKFITSFCTYFDPHTAYFSDEERSSFLSMISSNNLSFGLIPTLNEKEEIEVAEIIPGSPAYFSKKIESGDMLLSIKAQNETFEIVCASLDKIGEIFGSEKYKEAHFTLKKKNGTTYTVQLEKKVLRDIENCVYSYILEKENKKYGYIKIPSFYAIVENGKTNVSEDVAKEIIKLQKDGIDGLILDLENNGGGSLQEAINLSGMFIDIGPVAIIEDRQRNREILKDPARGALYTGNLVVLINGGSASASEFFTNTLHDYNRAIVIGNKSLGKATVQNILPIDPNNEKEFIKLTISKFYQVTGKSHQAKGIIPDIEIPSFFDKQYPREDSFPTALKNDATQPVIRYTPLENSFATTIAASKKRIAESNEVARIKVLNTKIDAYIENGIPSVLLQFDSVYQKMKEINGLWDEIKKGVETEYTIQVQQNTSSIETEKFDEYLQSNHKERIKSIKTNYHIVEALQILNDLKK